MVTLFQMMTEANFTKLEKREFLQRRSISIPAYPFGSVYKVKAYIKQFRKVSTTDRLIKDRWPRTAASTCMYVLHYASLFSLVRLRCKAFGVVFSLVRLRCEAFGTVTLSTQRSKYVRGIFESLESMCWTSTQQ